MPRKVTLKPQQSGNVTIIGISSHLKDYRLCLFLNQALLFNFRKADDFLQHENEQDENAYSNFIYTDPESRATFILISNHHPDKKLIPTQKQTDYFLITQDILDENYTNDLISRIRAVQQVNAAFKIPQTAVRDFEHTLNDLEFHLHQIDHN
ncbi:MAG: IPExxxVDY family protein [Bacteroidetes bacterium]|nr:IPExxxVDY family protein [Bacteroidota bacterium]